MEIGEKLAAQSRDEWRAWLSEHHGDKREIWLVLYKSGHAERRLTMREAQEEAVAFGWVDSNLKPLDASSYALRFTPRRPGSRWAPSNRARALKLLREGRMAPAGIAVLPRDVLDTLQQPD